MAIYTGVTLRYRGRLIDVGFRYGVYTGVSNIVGKPLNLTRKDVRKIQKLVRCKPTVQRQLAAQYEAINRFC